MDVLRKARELPGNGNGVKYIWISLCPSLVVVYI